MQRPTKVRARLKSDVPGSTAAKGRVCVQRQKTPAQDKTPARVRVGSRSAVRSVLPRAAEYCPTKMSRMHREGLQTVPVNPVQVLRTAARILSTRSSGSFSSPEPLGRSTLVLIGTIVRSYSRRYDYQPKFDVAERVRHRDIATAD